MEKNHKITLMGFAVIAIGMGVTDYLSYYFPLPGGLVAALLQVLAVALAFYWYWLDSCYRKYNRTMLLNIAVILIAFLAIPYYLYRSRIDKGRLTSLAVFASVIVGWYVFHYIGFYLSWAIERI